MESDVPSRSMALTSRLDSPNLMLKRFSTCLRSWRIISPISSTRPPAAGAGNTQSIRDQSQRMINIVFCDRPASTKSTNQVAEVTSKNKSEAAWQDLLGWSYWCATVLPWCDVTSLTSPSVLILPHHSASAGHIHEIQRSRVTRLGEEERTVMFLHRREGWCSVWSGLQKVSDQIKTICENRRNIILPSEDLLMLWEDVLGERASAARWNKKWGEFYKMMEQSSERFDLWMKTDHLDCSSLGLKLEL